MTIFKLKSKCWYDDYDCYYYISLYKDKKEIWQSLWWEAQDIFEDEDFYNNLRNSVNSLCHRYNIKIDTTDDYYWEWKVI
jgi:hypothetical protein